MLAALLLLGVRSATVSRNRCDVPDQVITSLSPEQITAAQATLWRRSFTGVPAAIAPQLPASEEPRPPLRHVSPPSHRRNSLTTFMVAPSELSDPAPSASPVSVPTFWPALEAQMCSPLASRQTSPPASRPCKREPSPARKRRRIAGKTKVDAQMVPISTADGKACSAQVVRRSVRIAEKLVAGEKVAAEPKRTPTVRARDRRGQGKENVPSAMADPSPSSSHATGATLAAEPAPRTPRPLQEFAPIPSSKRWSKGSLKAEPMTPLSPTFSLAMTPRTSTDSKRLTMASGAASPAARSSSSTGYYRVYNDPEITLARRRLKVPAPVRALSQEDLDLLGSESV